MRYLISRLLRCRFAGLLPQMDASGRSPARFIPRFEWLKESPFSKRAALISELRNYLPTSWSPSGEGCRAEWKRLVHCTPVFNHKCCAGQLRSCIRDLRSPSFTSSSSISAHVTDGNASPAALPHFHLGTPRAGRRVARRLSAVTVSLRRAGFPFSGFARRC